MFHIVLVEPEIPQNTGSIGRLCLATRCQLHLIRPLGFEITDAHLRRAGLDYWEHLNVTVHDGLSAFLQSIPSSATMAFFSKTGPRSYLDVNYTEGTYLFFGKETKGLPPDLLLRERERCFSIPILDARVRSLNLANAVSVAVYEGLRQLGLNSSVFQPNSQQS